MVEVLGDPALYSVIGGDPPGLSALRRRYERQLAGDPRGRQDWHNWIVRTTDAPRAVGYVQATRDRATGAVELALVIGTPWQGRGFASEAAQALAGELRGGGAPRLLAHVQPGHVPSERVAAACGMRPTGRSVDGEHEWAWVAGDGAGPAAAPVNPPA